MNMRSSLMFVVLLIPVIDFAQVNFSNYPVFGFAYEQENNDPFPVITSVTMGSPANLAHLEVGDHLTSLNGISLHNMPPDRIDATFTNAPMKQNKITVQHVDGTANDITINKANFISAAYKEFRYTIFFDENSQPIFNEGENCIWSTDDCQSGYGYYVFDQYGAFFGEFENNNRKEGLYYHPVFGKPTYYLGAFLNNAYEGEAVFQYANDDKELFVYKGNFHAGEPSGYGAQYTESGALVYEGEFKGWKFDGKGKYVYEDGRTLEGQLQDGHFVAYEITPSTETPDNTDYTADEIAMADKCRKAGLTEKEIRNLIMELRPTPQSETTTYANPEESLSGLDYQTYVMNQANANLGNRLVSQYDVGFSKYEPAICFTGCSSFKRMIYLIIEDNLNDPVISTLDVVAAQLPGDIGGDEPPNHFPFNLVYNDGGYAIYNCNMITTEIHSGCSYNWWVQSYDETRHFVRVLVYEKN